MTDVAPAKRPWELHAIVCLFAIAVGYAVSTYHLDLQHLMVIAGLTICFIGLFRGI